MPRDSKTHLYKAVIEGSTYKEFHAYIVARDHTEASDLICSQLEKDQLYRLRKIERIGDKDRRNQVNWLNEPQVIGLVELE